MALSQTGANYKNQSELQRRDRMLGEALDDISSQVQAVRAQGNYGQAGKPAAPHPLTSIAVVNASGFAQVNLVHAKAPAGTQYTIQYSTTPNFQSTVTIDNGTSLSLEQYLHGKTVYFRAAPRFPASGLASWIYFGGQANPTSTTF